jgi:phosphoribosyl 1,2-cyclic phosphodiesterase
LSDQDNFSVRFWGVRGSIACSGPNTMRYGGNTSSLEVRCGDRRILLDAGSGMRYLGNKLMPMGALDIDILLTHTHFDHICGMPFFVPFFNPASKFRINAGHLLPEHNVEFVLSEMMMAPLFPVPMAIFNADITFNDFVSGDTLDLGDGIIVRTAPLNHPNRATGYRIEYDGRSICYITDTEHVPGQPDENVAGLIRDADLVIYDGTYTDDEFPNHIDWGHSTWQEGLRLCEANNVKRYVLFHHDPERDDEQLDEIANELEELRPGTIVAREGLVLEP